VGEKQVPTPIERMTVASRGLFTTYGPTDLHLQSLENGKLEMAAIRSELEIITGKLLPELEKELEEAGAPRIEN
jgi:hypothetical protein